MAKGDKMSKGKVVWATGWDNNHYVSDKTEMETVVDAVENRGYGPVKVYEYDANAPAGSRIGNVVKFFGNRCNMVAFMVI